MKKSALSAALAGGPAPPPQTQPVQKASTFLDPAAFPCIEYAGVIDGTISEDQLDEGNIVDAFQGLEVAGVTIVGSAPTNVIFNGLVLVRNGLNGTLAAC
jgi:carnosine synthase